MTRAGWLLLLLFALVVGGFALVVRRGRAPAAPAAPAVVGDRTLTIPVAGVGPADLADSWGDARGDGTRAHHAIDILAPRGTPVVAAAAGRVEKLFTSRLGGLTVYVRRRDAALLDYYAHLDGYAPGLREGEPVRAGQPLGQVGATGDANQAAPHLHYEIKHMAPGERWWQGREIDPFPLLRATATGR